MKIDIRQAAAQYYDLSPHFPNDVPFYRALIPSPNADILELGCGTGRVMLGLTPYCRFYQGLDLSPAMIERCQNKLTAAGLGSHKALAQEGDITRFSLDRTFDLVIAPFRVMQNLESDQEVAGLFDCIRAHLAPGGSAVLNVFKPFAEKEELLRIWVRPDEQLIWEVSTSDSKLACYDRRPRLDPDTLALYPELIYRRYQGDRLVDEVVLKIVMRAYYPDQFAALIQEHGFSILNRWGGYQGEAYGEGPELVIQLGLSPKPIGSFN